MALINCPECGRQVSDKAGACPGCGYPIPSAQTQPVEVNAESVRVSATQTESAGKRRFSVIALIGAVFFGALAVGGVSLCVRATQNRWIAIVVDVMLWLMTLSCALTIYTPNAPVQMQARGISGGAAKCPFCGGAVSYQRIPIGTFSMGTNRVALAMPKQTKGCLYWMLFGWMIDLLFLPFKLLFRLLFGGWRNSLGLNVGGSKIYSKTVAVCQVCGRSW